MAPVYFPKLLPPARPPESLFTEDGILLFSRWNEWKNGWPPDHEVLPVLLESYENGIFPWPIAEPDEPPLVPWFCPPFRAILEMKSLHVPKSLAKFRDKMQSQWRITIDRAFDQVIAACARPETGETWITPEVQKGYVDFHRAGFAHSVEVWRDDTLVGGLYGVSVKGCYAGESMFHRESNASKIALLALLEHLEARGVQWIDIQQLTPHLEALGAVEIPRKEYLKKLALTQTDWLKQGSPPLFDSLGASFQRSDHRP